jgi:hypothetical protein
VAVGLLVAAVLALLVSPAASGHPDGLSKVATEAGFADAESANAAAGLPTAGYGIDGVDDDRLSTGLAGLLGVLVTFAVAGGGAVLLRRTGSRRS